MDSWWAAWELKFSLKIEDQQKAHLQELTGCNPILLHPLLSASRIIPDSQEPDPEEYHEEVIQHLLTTLEESSEVRKLRKNITDFVTAKHRKMTSEPEKWRS